MPSAMPHSVSASLGVSVVAPFYNEAEDLDQFIELVVEAMNELDQSWELILVDDASDDSGGQIVLEAAERDARIRLLSLMRRSGQSAALWSGLQACRGEIIVTLDADLQNPPQEIPRLVSKILETSGSMPPTSLTDMVAGIRRKRRDSFPRRAASRAANAIRRQVLGDPFVDSGCSLRAYRREFVEGVPCFSSMHRFLPILAVWNGARVTQIAVDHWPRRNGVSKYSALRGRAITGLFDLFGMLWLSRRWVKSPQKAREGAVSIGVPQAPRLSLSADSNRPQGVLGLKLRQAERL